MHGLAISVQRATNQPAAVDRITDMPEQDKHRLIILQWNCNCLTTKVVELSELTARYDIGIMHSAFNLFVFPNYMFTSLLLFFYKYFFMKGL